MTKATGSHLDGKTDSDVVSFNSTSKSLNFFPRNLEKSFENLNLVDLTYPTISKISKNDLESLGSQLKKLIVRNSNQQISKIDADLFEFNPNLVEIHLCSNKLDFIENGTFDKLENLETLHVEDNSCLPGQSHKAENNRSAVIELIPKIEKSCTFDGRYEEPVAVVACSECEKLKSDIEELKLANKKLKMANFELAKMCNRNEV